MTGVRYWLVAIALYFVLFSLLNLTGNGLNFLGVLLVCAFAVARDELAVSAYRGGR